MANKDVFDSSIKRLNAHLWLLLTLAEHTKGSFKSMPKLDGLNHEKVLPSFFHHAPTYAHRLRTKNKTLSKDMQELSESVEHWIPAYFLVLAKSIAECIAKDTLEKKYKTDPIVKAAIDACVIPKSTAVKNKDRVIEGTAQKIVRGAFNDVRRIIDLTTSVQDVAKVSQLLKKHSKTRNDIAHDLGEQYKGKAPVTVEALNEYIAALQEVIHAM